MLVGRRRGSSAVNVVHSNYDWEVLGSNFTGAASELWQCVGDTIIISPLYNKPLVPSIDLVYVSGEVKDSTQSVYPVVDSIMVSNLTESRIGRKEEKRL